MWDERYAEPGFAYGTEPNDFLREHAGLLEGPVLALCEGEGRNAAFLAGLGLQVLAVDASAVGLAKARELAARRAVVIETCVADMADYTPPANRFGAVIALFAHVPAAIRPRMFQQAVAALREGGLLLLEAYTPQQATRSTGGPRDPAQCMSLETLRREIPGCEFVIARETEREVIEGRYHTGLADVVQVVARKRHLAS